MLGPLFLCILKLMSKLLGVLFILFGLVSFITSSAYAAQEFSTDYDVTVTINTDKTAHITQKITITNTESGTYAKEYELSLSSLHPQNITARSTLGKLPITVKEEGEKTFIHVTLNQKVIGKDKALVWYLDYDLDNFVYEAGAVKSFSIPRVALTQGLVSYAMYLKVPQSFGAPASIFPVPRSVDKVPGYWIYEYDKEKVTQDSIHAIFGEKQEYDFTLEYTLTNPNFVRIDKKIVIPPTTPYQTVSIDSIIPQPLKVEVDKDGNWIATFRLQRAQKTNVIVSGHVTALAKPLFQEPLTKQQKQAMLETKQYWDTDSTKITSYVQQLVGNVSPNVLNEPNQELARKLYAFTIGSLAPTVHQKLDAQTRLGASETLTKLERTNDYSFVDVFVTLARAAHIPARAVFGFAYTPSNTDASQSQAAMHVWAEYYDTTKQIWIPVDPLWNTTSGGINYFDSWDLQHVALAFWGAESDYPYPDGLTALQNDAKPVLSIGQARPDQKPTIAISANVVAAPISGLPGRGEITVENTSKVALVNADVKITSDGFQFLGSPNTKIIILPPYGSLSVPFTFRSPKLLQLTASMVNVSVNGQYYSLPLKATPFGGRFRSLVLLPIAAGMLIGVLVLQLTHRRRGGKTKPKDKKLKKQKS